MSIYLKFTLWLVFVPFVICAQENDTLFIRFSDSLLNNSVFLNQINVYGDTIKSQKTDKITFLFSHVGLINKLKEKIEREKNGVIFGYSAGPPQYGVEFNYYQLTNKQYESYKKLNAKYSDWIQNIKNKGVGDEKLAILRKDLYQTLSPPLRQLYVDSSFLEGKTVFIYKGNKKSYMELKKKLENHQYVYIVMPFNFSNIYNYDYQLIQVKKRYIVPGL